MQIRTQRYYKFRYGNRLYTRRQARELGRTSLDGQGRELHVSNGRGWYCIMYLQECARGQKYVEEDAYLKKRDRFVRMEVRR